MILAQRPLRLPPEVHTKRRPAPSLQVDGKCKSNLFLAQYKNETMHAIRFSYLCCVLEGEIDIRLGIPSKQGKFNSAINSYQILTLPARTFLLIPPGVFHPDSARHHWERSPLPVANAKVFWMRVLPTGGFCHNSTAQNGKHVSDHSDIFVPNLHFSMLVEMLMDELRSPGKDAIGVAQNALTLLLSRTRRGLSDGALAVDGQTWKSTVSESSPPTDNSIIVDRACDYIRAHIDKTFGIKEVANYAYVSSSHLVRLFRNEMKTTVMKYALQQRLQYAQSLLVNSEISIEEIARFIGYQQTPQFNRTFKRIHHITPTEFRHRHRNPTSLSVKAKQ